MSFTVRAALLTDLDELLRLRTERMELYLRAEKRLAQPSLSEWQTALTGWLARPEVSIQVADRDGQLIGYMIGWQWQTPPWGNRTGVITEMSVDGHCKQGGVGTALLQSMKTWFQAQGITAIEVRVPRQQPIEQAFWRAVGAQPYIDHLYFRVE